MGQKLCKTLNKHTVVNFNTLNLNFFDLTVKPLRGEFFLCYVTCAENWFLLIISTFNKYRNYLSFDVSQTPHVLKTFVDCMSYTMLK